jgi:hypothetical protein
MAEWRHREFDLFVAANIPIYLFSIQYLGIHWISDVIPGVILAVICALFAHGFQPKLRNLRVDGLRSLAHSRSVSNTAVAFSVIGTLMLVFVVIDGPGTDENEPTMRVGPRDVNLDVIEVHSLWHPAEVEVRNVGLADVQILVIHRDMVEEHARGGKIDWSAFSNQDIQIISPGEVYQVEVETTTVFDGHYVLVSNQGDDGVGEVRITIEYVDGYLVWTGVLSSVPSFAISGLVVGGMIWSNKDEVSKQTSDE